MIAVQGPQALPLLKTAAGVDAAPMRRFGTMPHGDWLLARTGYTGEDGVEIMLPHDQAGDLWRRLVDAGIQPAGLAARDTLRLEAGFALYGQDMDESTSALEANLGWTVAWEPPERDFIGRKALEVGTRRGGREAVEDAARHRAGRPRRDARGHARSRQRWRRHRHQRFLLAVLGVQYRLGARAKRQRRRMRRRTARQARTGAHRQSTRLSATGTAQRTDSRMSETPSELRYASSHEWARLEDGLVVVGISDFAQDALGDVVYVELPEVDMPAEVGAEIGVVESVKTAADVYAPVSGTVVETNTALEEKPELVNEDPYGNGWFYKLDPTDPTQLDDLLDAEAYAELCESEEDG